MPICAARRRIAGIAAELVVRDRRLPVRAPPPFCASIASRSPAFVHANGTLPLHALSSSFSARARSGGDAAAIAQHEAEVAARQREAAVAGLLVDLDGARGRSCRRPCPRRARARGDCTRTGCRRCTPGRTARSRDADRATRRCPRCTSRRGCGTPRDRRRRTSCRTARRARSDRPRCRCPRAGILVEPAAVLSPLHATRARAASTRHDRHAPRFVPRSYSLSSARDRRVHACATYARSACGPPCGTNANAPSRRSPTTTA